MTSRINERELQLKTPINASWHNSYSHTSTISIANLPLEVTEGDLLILFSQCGVVKDVHLYRNTNNNNTKPQTHRRGLVVFEDYRSAVLAVDNFDEWEIIPGNRIRVAHSEEKVQENVPWRDDVVEMIRNWK
ncbi:U2 snRNP complex subunit [Pichia kluyveri]|uniref:U2 snRNP complex subunit n=1 Tax=Pichia kluyveri TaxID=36015 RepID=A0AAV5R4A6_PICKL|nr:U2 snRNP complex subunit [Pichia kluyveri]